jgi:hypothetical protein
MALVACMPFVRYVASVGDEGILLHGAMRMLGGEVLYRDVFGILPPAGYLIVCTWMKVFGMGLVAVRGLAIAVIVAITALTYLATNLAARSRGLAASLAIAWVLLSQGTLTVVSHHWLATAASMASAVCLLVVASGTPGRWPALFAGMFAGAAAMVSSMRGALACAAVLAILLAVPTGRPRLASAVVGMAVVPGAMVAYAASQAVLAVAFEEVILYPARHYTGIQALPFGAGAWPQQLALVVLFPAAFLLAGFSLVQRRTTWRDARLRTALLLATVGLLGSYPRPDAVHLAFTAPLVGPLFALVALEARRPGRIALAALFGSLCLIGASGTLVSAERAGRAPAIPTARGAVAPDPDLPARDFAALIRQVERTPPGSAFFFYPYSPLLPYLAARRHIAAVDVMIPGYTSAAQFRDTCVRVVTVADWVVIDRKWSPAFFKQVFPAIRDPDPPEMHAFDAALRSAFDEVVPASGRFELRRRSGKASQTLCDGI